MPPYKARCVKCRGDITNGCCVECGHTPCLSCSDSGMVHPVTKDGKPDYGRVVRCYNCQTEGGKQIGDMIGNYGPDPEAPIAKEELLIERMSSMMPRPCCHDIHDVSLAGALESLAKAVGELRVIPTPVTQQLSSPSVTRQRMPSVSYYGAKVGIAPRPETSPLTNTQQQEVSRLW